MENVGIVGQVEKATKMKIYPRFCREAFMIGCRAGTGTRPYGRKYLGCRGGSLCPPVSSDFINYCLKRLDIIVVGEGFS